jgi:hypothetical protein
MFGQIRPKLQDSGQTPLDPGHFGQIQPDSWPDPSRSSRIHPNPAGSQPFWSDPAGSMAESGQILPDSGHFGQTRPTSDHGRIQASFGWNLVRRHSGTVAGCHQISTPAVFQWSDVAGFSCHLDSDNQLLTDFDNRISNVCARTKSLISENDL